MSVEMSEQIAARQAMINESQPSHPLRVFLCHSSDDKSNVQDLYKRLCDDGFMPWLDVEDLLPGQDWEQAIARAVRGSDVVAVCLSQNSVNKRGYVQKEIRFALDVADEQPEDTIFIIPLKLEECDVPARLKRWQWVNLFEDRGYERLLKALRHRATGNSEPQSRSGKETNKDIPKVSRKVQPAPSNKRFTVSKRLWGIVLTLTVAVAIMALIAGYWFFIGKSSQVNTNNTSQYTGRVVDGDTRQVIQAARVSIESQGGPQVYYTNADGLFFVKLPDEIGAVSVRVEAAGYEIFYRTVPLSKTETKEIPLISSARASQPTPTPAALPESTPTPVVARPSRRVTQTNQPEGEDPALDILRGKKKDGNLSQRK